MADGQEAVIVSGVRTAIGTYGGGLADVPAVELGAICMKEALKRADLRPEQVDEVICLSTPANFYAVGSFYERFGQTSDDEVVRLMKQR